MFAIMQLFGLLSFILVNLATYTATERLKYVSLERPVITYYNPKYFRYINVTSRRLSRNDPRHYVDFHFDFIYPLVYNLTGHFYVYEWLSNQYRRTFVEFQVNLCDILDNDQYFGNMFKQGKLTDGCPVPAGVVNLYNMSVPATSIPENFPFQRGRLYTNITSTNKENELVYSIQVDVEFKEYNTKTPKRPKKTKP